MDRSDGLQILDRPGLAPLCRRCRVRRLDVSGSAVTGGFDPARSDLDFLVSFEPLPPSDYARAYFMLSEELAKLYGRKIDLLTEPSLANPYFRKRVEAQRQTLFGQ